MADVRAMGAWLTRPTPPRDPGRADAGHLAALDGVRGLAILIVLIHNTAWIAAESDAFVLKLTIAITATGWVGVQLFFVLSGFLITGILVDALGSPTFFRTFYVRRTLRIFPLYYAFLAFAFFALPHLTELPPAWRAAVAEHQWWYWSYTSNWATPFGREIPGLPHFWSLAVEEQFYLIWPLLVFSLSRGRLINLCALMVATTPFVRLFLNPAGLPPLAGYEFTIARWDALACGAILAILLREESGREWLRRRMRWITSLGLFALVVLVGNERGFHEGGLAVRVIGQTLIGILSASLIYFSIVPTSSAATHLQRALSTRWLRFLGKYSYAIYVFHVPIHTVASHYAYASVNSGGPLERLIRLAIYVIGILGLSTIAAMVSWRLLEKPFLDLKDRLAPRQRALPEGRAAPALP